MRRVMLLVIAVCFLVFGSVHAWIRRSYSDAEIVSRADYILVGRIKPDSIVFVPHRTEVDGMSWEHHAVLLISEVLKGNTSITSMPIAIHYGLEPAVGGVVSNQAGLFMDARMGSTNYPKDVIEILDSGRPGGRVASDIRMDHIWFLHRQPQERHDSDMIGVFDPEDIQPMDRKQAILKLIK